MSASSASRHADLAARALAGLAGLWLATAAAADEPAQALLAQMHTATRELNYDGVFVYQRGLQLDSMRLVHQFRDGSEAERLISLSGPAREVLRDGTRVTCLFADDHAGMVEKSAPRDIVGIGFDAPVERLVASYRFAVEGSDRVAGRPATVVGVVPTSDDRYGYRLWIDDASRLLLKSMVLDGGGTPLEQVQFTHLELLDQVPGELLAPEITGSDFVWRTDEASAEAGDTAADWQAEWLPAGFELESSSVQNMATSQRPVSHLVYSDGLAMVSVFVEAVSDDAEPLHGYSSRGAVNAFSRLLDRHQVTVVGEVPLPTVRRIAASVTQRRSPRETP